MGTSERNFKTHPIISPLPVQTSERNFENRLKKHPFPLQISERIKIFSQKGCAFGLSQWELVEGYIFLCDLGVQNSVPIADK